jgi:DeoR family fructose operon transcriptional repressor
LDLNAPDTRQEDLRARLAEGRTLVLAQLAAEFGVSPDTMRRDLIALEAAGLARRVRGGAMPVAAPVAPLAERLETTVVPAGLVRAALAAIGDAPTLLLDGGASVLAVARALPALPGRLVVTPAPRVAIAARDRGIGVVLIGGALSAPGEIATGLDAERGLADLAADVALIGVCGLSADWGLGADDLAEAGMKRQMIAAASRALAVTGAAKIGRRARHRVVPLDRLTGLVTDAPETVTAPFAAAGLETYHG